MKVPYVEDLANHSSPASHAAGTVTYRLRTMGTGKINPGNNKKMPTNYTN